MSAASHGRRGGVWVGVCTFVCVCACAVCVCVNLSGLYVHGFKPQCRCALFLVGMCSVSSSHIRFVVQSLIHSVVDMELGFLGGSAVKNLPAMQESQETQVRFLGQKDPLEEGTATHSSILAWRIPWTEEPAGL